jgi:hypothetical protein
MATLNVINTTLLSIYVDGVTPTHCNDAQISISMSPRDITTKDSGGYKEILEGLRSATASGGQLVAFDAPQGFKEHFAAIVAREPVAIMFSTEETGDSRITGNAYFTALDLSSSGSEDNVASSFTLEFTGEFEIETIV